MKRTSKGSGRKSEFQERFIPMACEVVKLGGTDANVAAALGYSVTVINKWKARYPKFREALKESKELLDKNVEVALYKRAVGYSHPDVDIRTRAIGDGMSEIVQTPITKHYPPDATSCIFWLKNRQSEKWRDRREVTGPDGGSLKVENATTFDPSKLTVEQLLALQALLTAGKQSPEGGA